MDPCLREAMLTQTIHVREPSTLKVGGGIGVETPAVPVAAYVEEVRRRQQTGIGAETVTTHKIWTEDKVTQDSIIWLPGLNPKVTTGSRRAQQVKVFYDPLNPIDADGLPNVDHYEFEV